MTRQQALEMILDPRGGPPPGTPEHREFRNFLENEPDCKRLYEEQNAVWESLELWHDVEPSAEFDRRLFEKIERRRPQGAWLGGLLGDWRPSFAVGLAGLVLAAALVIERQPGLADEPQVLARDGESADAEYGEELQTALEDIEMLAEFDVLPLGG